MYGLGNDDNHGADDVGGFWDTCINFDSNHQVTEVSRMTFRNQISYHLT